MNPDPFDQLGLEPRFDVDASSVRRRLVNEASRRHPDRAPDPVTAAAWTDELAALHAAADLVLDDIERAECLLRRRGGPGPSEDRSLPEGFLESMLMIRMELENALSSGDESGRVRLESWARDEWAARRAAVASLLDGPEGAEEAALSEVRRQLNRWRYAQRMLEQLDPAGRGGRY